ncbi:N-acetyltransferase [Chitiniphilus shinanonensis]|uniref:N-acetyltransferase n=1 Tax=Chitiniphilus shinanonensis TaxID=553088 RepID=A0ABQ6BV52_9NEIS|nr:GNAT family N-acetyltransferase [Chitiniphilus shinanonensis]GLS05252.1 N-acetyltransferase [Chitiniphilus shinanonensis]
MRVSVRYASLYDLDALVPLFDAYRVFYGQYSDPGSARTFLAERLAHRESVILLAELDGEPVGLLQLYPLFCSLRMSRIWLLNDLFVAAAHRSQGVARQLMAKAEEHAQHSGANRLELSTAHTNKQAQALYESLGYRLDEVFRYYALDIA